MKHSLLLKHSCQHPRGLAITMTWLLLLIFYALSGEMNSAQAQARAYVTDRCTNSVYVFDTATNALVTTIATSSSPIAIAIRSDGSRAFVTEDDRRISVIDTATNQVVNTFPLSFRPNVIAIAPDGGLLYVTHLDLGRLFVIDAATGAEITSVPASSFPNNIAITPDGT